MHRQMVASRLGRHRACGRCQRKTPACLPHRPPRKPHHITEHTMAACSTSFDSKKISCPSHFHTDVSFAASGGNLGICISHPPQAQRTIQAQGTLGFNSHRPAQLHVLTSKGKFVVSTSHRLSEVQGKFCRPTNLY